MDYIGSKEKVNEWMFQHMLNGIDPAKEVFLDACAGSGSVSKYAAKSGFGKIVSNDIMEFPSHIVRGAVSLPQSKMKRAHQLIQEMNTLPGIEVFSIGHTQRLLASCFSVMTMPRRLMPAVSLLKAFQIPMLEATYCIVYWKHLVEYQTALGCMPLT
jgi:hypothetical protein